MRVRLGYACITKTLNVTPSSVMTYTEYLKNYDLKKLDLIIKSNFRDLDIILDYNIKNDIYFYRLTSKLIPLATKEDVIFDYIDVYKEYYDALSRKVKKLRVDVHPDQFTVLNSTNKEVVEKSIINLEYHYQILKALKIKEKVILLHVGSKVFGKEASINRFIKNYKSLPIHLQKCIAIENDDKVYNVSDCLYIAEKLNIPFVLDYHHYICNNEEENLLELLPRIYNTWVNKSVIPKMHFSSPKSKLKKEFRSHHEYVDAYEFMKFLTILKSYDKDVDVMIEAKGKDEAMFRLIRELKLYSNYKFIKNDIIL